MESITNLKFIYDAVVPILHRNTTDFASEMTMNTATITQAHDKGLRHQLADTFGKIRDFAIELYTAHGGWFAHDAAQPASGAFARGKQQSLAHMMILGTACENYAPALAADMVRDTSN
jgi:hypothetical protein